MVLIEPHELHSDLPHLVGGDLDADWFHRRERPVGRVRGRRSESATSALHRGAPRIAQRGAFSYSRLVIEEEPSLPADSRAEPSSAVPRHLRQVSHMFDACGAPK